jgi:hypothetical protein
VNFDFAKLTEWLKLSPRLCLSISLLTGTLLFLPSASLEKLGLINFRDAQQMGIGFGFLLSVVLLISQVFEKIWILFGEAYRSRNKIRELQKSITYLGPQEKAILREYIENKQTTRYYELSNGVVNGLEYKKILYPSSQISAYYLIFPYNIQPWVWTYLNKHPEILEDKQNPVSVLLPSDRKADKYDGSKSGLQNAL